MKKVFALIIVSFFVIATSASAAIVIDFGTGDAGQGGTVTYSGGVITGTNIPLDVLSVSGNPVPGTFDLTGSIVAPNDAHISDKLAASLWFTADTTTNSGQITITGGVPALGIGSATTLLSGTFSYVSAVGGSNSFAFYGQGPDTKDPGLLTALGINPNAAFNFMSFSLGANLIGGGSPYTVTSTDIQNVSTTTGEVPIPPTVWLLGAGLIGLVGLRRKFFRK